MLTAWVIKHFLIPQESNNHKPKILHLSSLLLLCFFFVFYQLSIYFATQAGIGILGYAANISVDEVINLTNQKRAEAGLPPLSNNSTLASAAHKKGEDMLNKDYWAHVAPDGTQPWKFITDSGYGYRYAGENLARDFSNASSAVEAWMASPTHKENILSPKYKEIGIAVVEGDLSGADTTLIVQFFGTSTSDSTTGVVPVAQASEAKSTAAPTIKPVQTKAPVTTAAPIAVVKTVLPNMLSPQPIISQVEQGVENDTKINQRLLISPFTTTKTLSLFIVGLLLMVLVIDGIIISKRKIIRIGGRTFAHLSFLGMILVIAIILKAGQIL